ncbi:MAG: hypothetical protein ACE5G9_06250 [Nitrospinales bacterium]
MKYHTPLNIAILALFVFASFSSAAANVAETDDGTMTFLKDPGGKTLAVSFCSVTHRDGSTDEVKVRKDGSIRIKKNESGILICARGDDLQGAMLSNYHGGAVNMVPMDLTFTALDAYRHELRGTAQQTVDMESIGLGGIWAN